MEITGKVESKTAGAGSLEASLLKARAETSFPSLLRS